MKLETRIKTAKFLTICATVLCIAELLLSILCFTDLTQVSFTHEDEEFAYSLWKSIELPSSYSDSSYSCLSQLDGSLGERGDLLISARAAFLSGDLIALAALVLLLIRLCHMLNQQIATGTPFLTVLAVIQTVGKVFAWLLFALLSGLSLSEDCDSVCAGVTVYFMILSAILSVALLACILIINKVNPAIRRAVPLKPDLPEILVIQLGLVMATSLVLHIVAVFVRWIKYKSPEEQNGGLFVVESIEEVEDAEYCCICFVSSTSPEDRVCDAMMDLWNAGFHYLVVSGISFICFMFWAEQLICSIFNFSSFRLPIQYGLPWITVLLHTAALIVWFRESGASLGEDCVVSEEDSSIPVCAASGPVLSLCSLLLLILSAIASHFAFKQCEHFTNESRNSTMVFTHSHDKSSDSQESENNSHVAKGVNRTHDKIVPSISGSNTYFEDTTQSFYNFQQCSNCSDSLTPNQLHVAECGHILHKACGKRIDKEPPCSGCKKS